MIARVCEICKKDFKAWPFKVRQGIGRFCSRPCGNIGKSIQARAKALSSRPAPQYLDDYALIPVGARNWMKVSLEDADALSATYWEYYSNGYAANQRQHLHAHRVVIERMLDRKLLQTENVDHKNHDGLDNRRQNLRVATDSENNANRRSLRQTSSQYRGVSFCKQTGRWRASVGGRVSTGSQLRLGRYQSEEEAAWMYDQWASQLFGEFSILNFDYV